MLTIAAITTLLVTANLATAAAPRMSTRIAETIVSTWRCQDKLPVARMHARSPWKPHSAAYRAAELQRWQQRLQGCQAILKERARQWNWQAFTTAMERAVAMCETQLNWRHSSTGYGGAYGFARSSWDAFKPAGYPAEPEQATPWQQTVVARRIHDRYGWSGWGCVTHGGYRVWLGRV
jgi:hypothetical protein